MKKTVLYGLLLSVLFAPSLTFAQAVDETLPTVEIVAPEGEVVLAEPVLVVEEPVLSTEPVLEGPVITIYEPIPVPNPALDVVTCGDKFIYAGGTYDQYNKIVTAPVCTTYQMIGIKYSAVDFGASNSLPIHNIEVNFDGKIVFTEPTDYYELNNRLVQGETDSQIYLGVGGMEFGYLQPITEATAISLLGENYQDQVVYFDDSIVYSYKIID